VEKMEVSYIFAPVISQEEWASVPTAIAKKLETFVGEKFEELITSKALLETNRRNAGSFSCFIVCFKILRVFFRTSINRI
jgi:hypothetical protein